MFLSVIDFFFFFYMFLGLYMSSVLLFIYLQRRDEMYGYVKGKPEPVSIVVPCYNEERTIGETIDSLVHLDYPRGMIEVIVVDDCSSDNSVKVARERAKKYNNVRVIVNSHNSGGAAEPTNIGIKAAKYSYIAVADSDSTPDRDALRKMIGYLQEDPKVAAVTCAVLARKPKVFMQKLQAIEYSIIAWSRKLLDYIDSVYVTPGPFALYRKKNLIEVGLFDTKNMTQDIEIVWRLLSAGYKARMCLATRVYSETPTTFRAWFKQRIRWNIGGNQTLLKYKSFFLKRGMLGAFIIPFFALSLFLGLFGLALFVYLWVRRFLVTYLTTKYSLYADSSIFNFSDLSFTPSVLNFFGAALFFLGIFYTFFGLVSLRKSGIREKGVEDNVFNVIFYSLVYLTLYPIIVLYSLYKHATGKYTW